MTRSQARVDTDRPSRYAKQLVSHLGRRVEGEWSEESGTGRLSFPDGTATLTAQPDALLLDVDGDADHIERLEDVVGRHLVRFGAKDELVVEWQRDTGEAGLVHRYEG
ncbi:DUF2218 domain-containing protein [Pseudonocardiaceae bacterium YIM PH 21723]|nr:DUF2218 domain-containing protein [Pseudonocardiaceae bacterium YIM PH 21723]